MNRVLVTLFAVLGLATPVWARPTDNVVLIATQGKTLYRIKPGVSPQTFSISNAIIAATNVPSNVRMFGGNSSACIGAEDGYNTSTNRQNIYRVAGATDGTPTLVLVGTLSAGSPRAGVNDLAFAGTRLFGCLNLSSTVGIREYDVTTGNVLHQWDTGVAGTTGALAYNRYDELFYFRETNSGMMWKASIEPSVHCTLVGGDGLGAIVQKNDYGSFGNDLFAAYDTTDSQLQYCVVNLDWVTGKYLAPPIAVFPRLGQLATALAVLPCGADFNGDGFIDIFDFVDYVTCFEGGDCPGVKDADFNEDGFADVYDFIDFVSAFERGC